MMFDIERSIKENLADIAKELGIQMNYRSAMPDGQTAHYVQYRYDERSAWTSQGMRDYPTSDGLHEELMSWHRLLSCRFRADRMRLEKEREANNE